jgi:hypothetical protein
MLNICRILRSTVNPMVTPVVVLFFTLLWSLFPTVISAYDGKSWSTESTPLYYPMVDSNVKIISPDKQKFVIVTLENGLRVIVEGNPLPGLGDEGVYTLSELGWAPDSNAFFITESEGGSVGEWTVTVYLIENKRVRRINIASEVKSRFKKEYTCYEPEDPETAGIKWLKGSQELLLVAEVPPHSSCPEMGKKKGYVVQIPSGNILKELTEDELKVKYEKYIIRGFNKK